LIQVVIIAVFF